MMFITFEGPEGSGKSTQIRLLAAALAAGSDRPIIVTREPGGTPIGDQIRATLHDVANRAMTAEAEILLYAAARAQHVGELIRPNLEQGAIVLCDRFYDSTTAYQGYGRGLDLSWLQRITTFATGGLVPDLTLLLDLDVEQGLARRVANAEEMNRLDLEAVSFHQRVRAGYHALVAQEPQRWVVVDANRPIPAIQADLYQIVVERLARSQ
jgi:dTMP kinase